MIFLKAGWSARLVNVYNNLGWGCLVDVKIRELEVESVKIVHYLVRKEKRKRSKGFPMICKESDLV